MALTPQNSEAFLREVDEELRRDQILGFWRRYGRVTAGVIVLGLAALAGVLGWQYYREQAAAAQSDKFNQVYDLLSANKSAQAAAPLDELAKSDNPTYRALALYVQADVILRDMDPRDAAKSAGKLRDAAAKFAAVAGDSKVAQPLRDLALVRQTYAELDQIKPETVVERMKPLAVPNGPWLGSAGELIANAYLQLNQPQQARTVLQQIVADLEVPDTIRQRAAQLSSAIDNGTVGSAAGGQVSVTKEANKK